MSQILRKLMDVINDRRETMPERSYTTSLFQGGVDRIGSKVREEAEELIEAASECGPLPAIEPMQHVTHEAADLFYHAMVLMAQCQVDLTDVEAELARRFGISGIDEKASRQTDHH